MSLLEIRVLGDPVLRQETKIVTEVTTELRRLVDDMFETMYAAKGIGLAAPQVGRLERPSLSRAGLPVEQRHVAEQVAGFHQRQQRLPAVGRLENRAPLPGALTENRKG